MINVNKCSAGTMVMIASVFVSYGYEKEVIRNPNVVVVLVDDLGNKDVGFNGCEDIPTPNIDRIANEGVKFSNGYVTYAVSGPSRAGLMTGRYQDRFGFSRNPIFSPEDSEMGLPLTEQTLGDIVKSVGYKTMGIGKWHLGAHPLLHPNERGFDEFFGFLGGGHRYFPEELTINSESEVREEGQSYRTKLQHNGKMVEEQEYLTDAFSREAVSFIRENAQRSFFLYLAYNAPHTPLQATDKYLDRFQHINDEKRRTYAAMVSAVDDGVGLLLEQLEASGISDNTIVFFLSDNGGPKWDNSSDNGILRGGKSTYYEGGIRVPFAMRWPEKIKEGEVCETPVISLDIAATIAANINKKVTIKNKLDGIDLLPVVTNPVKNKPKRTLFWRMYDRQEYTARNGEGAFKILLKPDGNEMYNLDEDISERRNLLNNNQYQPEYGALVKELEDWLKDLKEPIFLGLVKEQIDEYWRLRNNQMNHNEDRPKPRVSEQKTVSDNTWAKNRTQYYKKELSLTDEQTNKVYEVMFAAVQKAQEIRQSKEGDEQKIALWRNGQDRNEKLFQILTPEQTRKIKALWKSENNK